MSLPYEAALQRAQAFVGALIRDVPRGIERIEIAGSIRRKKPLVKDIEIVVQPRVDQDLFGAPTDAPSAFDLHIESLLEKGTITKRTIGTRVHAWGPRYKAIHLADGTPLDLFSVVSPAQWGAIFAIRTGPHDFSRRLVTDCKRLGLRCEEGRLIRIDGSTVETPEEIDFLHACGSPWVEPENRA